MTMQPGILERWRKGEPLLAEKLNQPVDLLARGRGAGPANQVIPHPIAPGEAPAAMQRAAFWFKRMFDDHFDAYRLGADGQPLTDETGERLIYQVAKPFDLRTTPFHRRRVRWFFLQFDVTYFYSTGDIRTATRSDTGDSFFEIIWKPYEEPTFVTGDPDHNIHQWIWADKVGEALTGVPGVEWLDRNDNGRLWAEPPE
jgi:hypothetical protein